MLRLSMFNMIISDFLLLLFICKYKVIWANIALVYGILIEFV